MQIMKLREEMYTTYINYERYAKYLVRFLMSFAVIWCTRVQFPYYPLLNHPVVAIGLAIFMGFLPSELVVISSLFYLVAQLYFLSPLMAGIVGAACILIYMMLLRYSPKTILVAVLLPIALALHVPLVVVIPVGMFFSPMAILSIAGATVLYFVLEAVKNCQHKIGQGTDMVVFLNQFADSIMKNPKMYGSLVVLCVISLGTYFIRHMKRAYAFELSVLFATVAYPVLGLVAAAFAGYKEDGMLLVLGDLIGGALGLMIHFGHMVLDYGAVEYVEFEDEDYYYYVKAIPKLKTTPKKECAEGVRRSRG